MLRFYSSKKYRVIPIERGSYDPEMEFVVANGLETYDPKTTGTYDLETERTILKFPWDPDNFETLGDLHDFLAEYLGFEPEPEGYLHPMGFDWAKIAEEIELPQQLTAA